MSWKLDVNGFVAAVTGQLADANGYSMELRRRGVTLSSSSAGDAINGALESTPSHPVATVPWSTDVRMHIASCSKMITAMALTKIIGETHGKRKVTPDDQILPYLPDYWNPGSSTSLITFADLMTNTSALYPPSGPGTPPNQTYIPAREAVEAGVIAANIGGAPLLNYSNWDYQNTNWVLGRVLMATVSGAVDVGLTGQASSAVTQEQANDQIWDARTVEFYERYVRDNIFAPAGITATLRRPKVCALAYAWPADGQPGWNSGDLTDWAGPAGWHMSVRDLLDVMGTFRRGGRILPEGDARAMLEARFGVDWGDNLVPQDSLAGALYPKNGGQQATDADQNPQDEQSGAIYLPLDMECVVFVNSVTPGFLLTTIAQAFVDNL
jgi:CubicO group peptidase (beta-lactamase class C family)